MKTVFPIFHVFPLFLILFFTFLLNAQIVENWTPPVALTDSISNNSNPVVVVLQDNGVDELFMFYNKYDEPYRQIWWRKISGPMSEEQMLFGVYPELDFRNPKILFNNFLIFEMNAIYDEYDLFGVKIDPNGLAGDFFQLTNTGYDENSLYTSSGYYSSICCWESEGNIYVAEPQISQDTLVLEGIEILDSVDCYDPVCQEYYVAWRKVENNESHIYYSEKNISSNQWSVPVAIIDTGNNVNLSLAVSVPDVGGGYNLCWQANNRIYLSELSGYYMFSPEIPGIEYYYEPVAFNVLLVTDVIYGFYSFAGGIVSQRDIFIVDEDVSNYMLNITDDPYVNKNPRLFAGRGNYYYFEIINIWQTEMNGNDVLFGSFARYNVVIGSVDENEMSELDIYPIPFTETLNIDFIKDKAELTILEIFTISGKRVLQREIQGQANILQSITWSPESEGVTLSEGIYFVKLKLGESSIVRKVVYSK